MHLKKDVEILSSARLHKNTWLTASASVAGGSHLRALNPPPPPQKKKELGLSQFQVYSQLPLSVPMAMVTSQRGPEAYTQISDQIFEDERSRTCLLECSENSPLQFFCLTRSSSTPVGGGGGVVCLTVVGG